MKQRVISVHRGHGLINISHEAAGADAGGRLVPAVVSAEGVGAEEVAAHRSAVPTHHDQNRRHSACEYVGQSQPAVLVVSARIFHLSAAQGSSSRASKHSCALVMITSTQDATGGAVVYVNLGHVSFETSEKTSWPRLSVSS
eukprot:COSAG01_NODE_4432_length_5031_cov_3.848540_3_plen_142_part_00